MLKHFHTFETNQACGIPHSYGLLCAGKTPADAVPWAWVDTINRDATVNYVVIEHDTHCPLSRVIETICRLTDTELDMDAPSVMDQANTLLLQYMVDKANEKRATRQRYFHSQTRRYGKSIYAATDAAMAQMPQFHGVNLPLQLGALRQEIPYSHLATLQLSGLHGVKGLEKPTRNKEWRWADYQEHPEIKPLIHDMICERPRRTRESGSGQERAKSRIGQHLDKVAMRTPRSRLTYLIRLIDDTPKYHIPPKYNAAILKWIYDNPAPMRNLDPSYVAQMGEDTLLALIAEQRTWLDRWYLVSYPLGVRSPLIAEEVSEYTYDAVNKKTIETPFPEDVVEWFNREVIQAGDAQ